MKFSKDRMLAVLYEEEGEIVSDEIDGHRRWSVDHTLIFRLDDKVWRAGYSRGATESQDEGPWEYEDEVDVDEMELVEKIVKVWEVKK